MSVCMHCQGTGLVRANRMVSGKYVFGKTYCSCKRGVAMELASLREARRYLVSALEKAIECYGKPGAAWSATSESGTWIADARAAIAKATGVRA